MNAREYITNLVLVTVHPRQCANVREDVLQRISELESVDISKTKLHMSVDNEFSEPKNLATQVKCVSETRLLTFLCGQSPKKLRLERVSRKPFFNILDRLQVHIVVKVQVVQILEKRRQIKNACGW
jgi:hypothetical protein